MSKIIWKWIEDIMSEVIAMHAVKTTSGCKLSNQEGQWSTFSPKRNLPWDQELWRSTIYNCQNFRNCLILHRNVKCTKSHWHGESLRSTIEVPQCCNYGQTGHRGCSAYKEVVARKEVANISKRTFSSQTNCGTAITKLNKMNTGNSLPSNSS